MRIKTSTSIGIAARIDSVNTFISGMPFIVLKGLKILTVLITETLLPPATNPTTPVTTTTKSKTFHGSVK